MPKIKWVHMSYQDDTGVVRMITLPAGSSITMDLGVDVDELEELTPFMQEQPRIKLLPPATVTITLSARGVDQTSPLYIMQEMQ